jgi:hypothetical protein
LFKKNAVELTNKEADLTIKICLKILKAVLKNHAFLALFLKNF